MQRTPVTTGFLEKLEKEDAQVVMAEALYHRYHALCFWSFDLNLKIEPSNVPWVADRLRCFGDMRIWKLANELCPPKR